MTNDTPPQEEKCPETNYKCISLSPPTYINLDNDGNPWLVILDKTITIKPIPPEIDITKIDAITIV